GTPVTDTPPGGFAAYTNEGYGAECQWAVDTFVNRGVFIPGHTYRIQFMVHDGDQNKGGGDVGQGCATIHIPRPPPCNGIGERIAQQSNLPGSVNYQTAGNLTSNVYPNPFISSTTIEFQRADRAANTVVEVFTITGK